MIPLSSAYGARGSWYQQVPEYFRRVWQFDQMEFDSALSQLFHCITSPAVTAKISKARKMTKNHYHRDDPAFVVLQIFFIIVASISFGLAHGTRFMAIVSNTLAHVTMYYLAAGLLLATAARVFAHSALLAITASPHHVRRDVEWRHAFDIHCNGYSAYFFYTSGLHYLLLPLTERDGFLPRLIANSIYVIGAIVYFYNVFRGYLELPSLSRQEMFLYPVVLVAAIAFIVTFIIPVNASLAISQAWWSSY